MHYMQALDLQIIVVFSVVNGRVLLCLCVSRGGRVWGLALPEWQIPCTVRKHFSLDLNNYAEYAGVISILFEDLLDRLEHDAARRLNEHYCCQWGCLHLQSW